MGKIDFTEERTVIGGPYSLFDGSMIGEFLEPSDIDATLPAKHSLTALGKKHPVVPPLHVHFDQAESFKVIQGKWGVTTGWDQKDTIITPEMPTFVVPPMLPHTPWPVACDEDTVLFAWGHPTGTPKPLSTDFFRQIFFYTQDLFETKKSPDLLQLMLMQYVTTLVH
ncbi:hypothetical protein PRZ48_012068 [Zasmidium cellare]|uniref:Uncharacterized protein n=1 Tax=Zasmidium cellare TaxID=395010 RepID=A0ABR0E3T9_ZASCE|nr:hypothetical protein PRZ48_012068 [Zasmidium cellare]